jgi:hypothetical protein
MNDRMIESVYAALVVYRPQLKSFLQMDEEEGEEEVDNRFLADLIIRTMPWPVGIELRRLFSAALAEPHRQRLDQLFKTFERTLQFMCFAFCAQLLDRSAQTKIAVDAPIAAEFKRRWQQLTLGNITWLIAQLQRTLEQNGIEPFLSESKEALTKEFFAACETWVPERNAIGHYLVNLDEEQIQVRCMELQEKLTAVLCALAFLGKYKMVSVRGIQVEKQRREDAHYTHLVHILNSANSDFKAQEIDQQIFTESRSVLLLKTTKDIGSYLNLSPFIVDTGAERIDSKEKAAIKKDIFLYSKFTNDIIHYSGTEATDKHDLRPLSNYQVMMNDMRSFIAIFD